MFQPIFNKIQQSASLGRSRFHSYNTANTILAAAAREILKSEPHDRRHAKDHYEDRGLRNTLLSYATVLSFSDSFAWEKILFYPAIWRCNRPGRKKKRKECRSLAPPTGQFSTFAGTFYRTNFSFCTEDWVKSICYGVLGTHESVKKCWWFVINTNLCKIESASAPSCNIHTVVYT